MSFFTPQTKVIRIDDQNTVTVRRINTAEKEALGIVASQHGKDGELAAGVVSTYRLLEMMILSWDGPGFDGRPVSRENIRELPSAITDIVVEQGQQFSMTLTDGEKKA